MKLTEVVPETEVEEKGTDVVRLAVDTETVDVGDADVAPAMEVEGGIGVGLGGGGL